MVAGAAKGARTADQKDFLDALEKIVLGPECPLLVGPEEWERIAYHEGVHAILGLGVPGSREVALGRISW